MNIGIHIEKGKDLFENLKYYVEKLDINTVQIFVVGPRNSKENNIDKDKIREYCIDNNILLYIHSNYITNIWWSDEEYKIKENLVKCNYQMEVKINELKISDYINSKGVVIHISSVDIKQVESSLIRMAELMIKNNIESQLIIEMSACKATPNTYETPDKLNVLSKIINDINEKYNKELFSICIDTSHIWAGGIDISSYIKTRNYFSELNDITKKVFKLLHFNANIYNRSSGRDNHMKPFENEDAIWNTYKDNKKESGVAYFMEYCHENKIPIICERHNDNTTDETLLDEINILKNIIQ